LPEVQAGWIADNQRKGISPGAKVITVQATPKASRAWWEMTDEEVLSRLRAELRPLLPAGSSIRESQLKRWRFALPTSTHLERTLRAEGVPPLFFAGDAFGGPRIEGAVLSGLTAAAALQDLLS
jgi:predicted NAD/FAD-dependent oxidoreductase